MDEIILKSEAITKQILFLFHGYGANKDDLLPVGDELKQSLPNTEIRLKNGIESCDGGFGRQWFPLRGEDIQIWSKDFENNAPEIMKYIDSVINEKNLSYRDVILAGFSQGAMISLSLGLRLNVKAVIAFSGLLLSPPISGNNINTKVLLTHGALDDVIPISAMHLAEEALQNLGVDVKTVSSANVAHGIDNYILSRTVDFLKGL